MNLKTKEKSSCEDFLYLSDDNFYVKAQGQIQENLDSALHTLEPYNPAEFFSFRSLYIDFVLDINIKIISNDKDTNLPNIRFAFYF